MISLCFSSCQLSCASFAIKSTNVPTEVGNVRDSDLYTDSAMGIPFVLLVVEVEEDKFFCYAQAM